MKKSQARAAGLIARSAVSHSTRRSYDAALLTKMKALSRNEPCIGCYVSMKDEADTLAYLSWCISSGRNVAVPKVEGSTLGFYRISSLEELQSGAFGVLEPEGNADSHIPLEAISLMFVPLSSFDETNQRTGYGKGYYDSVLLPSMKKIGIAYPEQQVPGIEADPWDIPLDQILLP
ncbi:MAG: 5-formyltetrahydrofolate cyclo-ligase [Solobacterium sp.]|nr:5-formyltetrahydrofolate cyclo-ligase [Solobacterium sp.]